MDIRVDTDSHLAGHQHAPAQPAHDADDHHLSGQLYFHDHYCQSNPAHDILQKCKKLS